MWVQSHPASRFGANAEKCRSDVSTGEAGSLGAIRQRRHATMRSNAATHAIAIAPLDPVRRLLNGRQATVLSPSAPPDALTFHIIIAIIINHVIIIGSRVRRQRQ